MRNQNDNLTWTGFLVGLLSDPEIKSVDLVQTWNTTDEPLDPTLQSAIIFVRKQLHTERLFAANAGQEQLKAAHNRSRSIVAAWSIERVRSWLQEAVSGAQGPDLAQLANALYCNRDESQPATDDEVRTLVADIMAVCPTPPEQ